MLNLPITALKRAVQCTLRHLGYELQRVPRDPRFFDDFAYEIVKPAARYSPWIRDEVFQDTFKAIQKHTLVDKYRCYELWTLVEQTQKIGGSIIEIGVWRGGTGALIARKAKLCGITEPVYLCDTFTGVVKASPKDHAYRGGEHSNTSRQIVETLIFENLKLDNVKILEGIFPDQTAQIIEQKSFGFCHIDVDVYQSAKDIIDWIWDKMVVGGIVVYDDYGFMGCDGITRYVEEQRLNKDRLLIHNLNGHAVIIKIK